MENTSFTIIYTIFCSFSHTWLLFVWHIWFMVPLLGLKLKKVKVRALSKILCKACKRSLYGGSLVYPLVPAAYHSVPVQATGEGSCWQALCLPVYCPKAAGYRLQVSASLHTMLYPKRQSSSSHAECISLAIIHFHDIFGLSDVSTSCVVLLLLSSKQQHWPWSRFWPTAGHFKFSLVA